MTIDITSTEYTIVVYNPSGAAVGYITDFSDLAIGQITNGYDTFQMAVVYNTPGVEYLVPDARIVVYRQNNLFGIQSYVAFSGTILKTVLTEAEITTLTVTAFGFEEILSRRIVAWKDTARGKVVFPESPTAGFEYPSSIIRKLVNTNVGTLAESTREVLTDLIGLGRTINGVIPEFNNVIDLSDFGLAISSYDGISQENLLETIQAVATEGKVGFEVSWDPTTKTYSFDMAAFRMGVDRTNTVKFSIGNGTVGSIETTTDYSQSWNVALMDKGGTGASARRFVYPSFGNRPTGLAQRETFLTSATGTTAGNLATAVLEYKNMQKSITQIQCSIQQSEGLVYGRDYFISDLVTVETALQLVQLQVKQVTLSISSDGVETVGVLLESE
jgi:hypothetical protein